MSGPLVIATGLIYLGVAVDQFFKANHPMAFLYLTYALGTIPFYIMLK